MNRDDEIDESDDNDRPRRGRARREVADAPKQSNPAATASLVLGVLALCGGILSLPAMICAIIGLTKAKSRGGAGQGMAIGGLVLSIIGLLVILPIVVVGGLLLPAMSKVREASSRMASQNNMKQIGIAMHSYTDVSDKFPGPSATGQTGPMKERLSWRYAILPYIEQQNLFAAMDPKSGWNSTRNQQYSATPIKTYGDPLDAPDNQTRFRVFYNGGAMFDEKKQISFAEIKDGSSNTIMFVEATDRVPWAQCNEFEFNKSNPLPALGHPKRDGFMVILGDGSVRFIRNNVNPEVVKGMIHASDGQYMPTESLLYWCFTLRKLVKRGPSCRRNLARFADNAQQVKSRPHEPADGTSTEPRMATDPTPWLIW